MPLFNDILTWSETKLLPWQRDAARRLFQQENGLTDEDYTQLYDLLKAAHGMPIPSGLKPVPLAAQHLPVNLEPGEAVTLKAMRDLKDVNRIASGQALKFAPSGMTVIYGGNGTGKSGYARVMKRACRARDQSEQVHPDASDPAALARVPEAVFDVEINGTPQSVKWAANSVPPDELSTIAVFDCHCARAYLTSEQDVEFLPYGLDVVESLANMVLPELSRRLEQELAGNTVDAQPFQHLLGDTAVGALIKSLSHKTNPAQVRKLGTLSDAETQRIEALDRALAEADPQTKAKELRLSAGRLKALVGRIETALALVDDDALAAAKKLDVAGLAATEAEKVAAEALRAGETLLPGTGDSVWKSMFDAARKFSTEVAYPGLQFPHTAEGALCPLCQEPLEDGGERLARFEEYIRADAAKAAEHQRQKATDARMQLARAHVSIGLDDSATGELQILDATIIPKIAAFQDALEVRRKWMLEAMRSHVWNDAPNVQENPRQPLRNLAARQLRLARVFEKAANEKHSQTLKLERDALRARHNLSTAMEAILALIERMKQRAALESCKKDLNTTAISKKSKEFASGAVTTALKTALDVEFDALGIGHIRTKLKERNEKGKIKHRLLLDLPTTRKVEEILSEGEQRAIAIGSFLAELKLANHAGGIVFDDPVSSLDHWRRQNVARRLADEATRRQVIVFTHDTSFLGQLLYELEQQAVPCLMQFVECRGTAPGHISEGLPWEHKSYKDRIDQLQKAQRVLEKKPWPAYPSEDDSTEMRRQYSRLRATIERVVQDVVFNGVVRRFESWIRVGSLHETVGFEESECQRICGLYQRCSDVVEAHDPASGKNASVPTAKQLAEDIEQLNNVVEVIQTRRKRVKAAGKKT